MLRIKAVTQANCWKEFPPGSSTFGFASCRTPGNVGCATTRLGAARGLGGETLPEPKLDAHMVSWDTDVRQDKQGGALHRLELKAVRVRKEAVAFAQEVDIAMARLLLRESRRPSPPHTPP